MNIQQTLQNIQPDIDDIQQWADGEYEKYFSKYFVGEVELYQKLQDKDHIITDDELEWILTALPLELFSVSEQLSKLKTIQEVIKLHIKEVESKYINDPTNEDSATKRKEDAAMLTAGDKLLVTVYSNIAERVGREISFSRELIMSAKKIWDARRSSEISVPTLDTEDELPDYDPGQKPQTYVK